VSCALLGCIPAHPSDRMSGRGLAKTAQAGAPSQLRARHWGTQGRRGAAAPARLRGRRVGEQLVAGQAVLLLHGAAEDLLHAAGQHRQAGHQHARQVALAARRVRHRPAPPAAPAPQARASAARALLSGSALGLRMRTGMEQQVLSPGCVAVLNKFLSVQAHLTTGTLVSKGRC